MSSNEDPPKVLGKRSGENVFIGLPQSKFMGLASQDSNASFVTANSGSSHASVSSVADSMREYIMSQQPDNIGANVILDTVIAIEENPRDPEVIAGIESAKATYGDMDRIDGGRRRRGRKSRRYKKRRSTLKRRRMKRRRTRKGKKRRHTKRR